MGIWDDDSNTDLGYLTPQVLGVDLGPSGSTFIAAEPGMNARANPSPGTELPAGNLYSDGLVFDLPGGTVAANFFYWNGTDTTPGGDPNFVPVAAGTSLSMTVVRMGQPTTAMTVDGSTNPETGLHWGQKIDGNILHQHPSTSLQAGAGTPAEGIYLLALQFRLTDNTTSIDPSDPVFLLFDADDGNPANNPSPEPSSFDSAMTTAISWTADNYSSFQVVPEPATFWLLMLGGVGIVCVWRPDGGCRR